VFDVRAPLHEKRHDAGVSVEGREVERRAPAVVRVLQVGAAVQQEGGAGEVTAQRRPAQRREALPVSGAQRGACSKGGEGRQCDCG
jgi:hypothetical protein